MLMKCHKVISPATKKDLGDKSLWLTKGNIYTVLALDYSSKFGLHAYTQKDHHNEPSFTSLIGFEIISQHIPSTWVTIIKELNGIQFITMMPESLD